METHKKRRRETRHPRITYHAATTTFDRLFKEDSLDGMKEVVRRKLGVSTSIPVHLSQERNGKTVALDDDEDFEAFCEFALDVAAVQVTVVLGSGASAAQTKPKDLETTLPSKKKRRRSDASSTLPPPASTVESPTPPQKKRRVSFVESSPKPPPEIDQSHEKKKKRGKQKEALANDESAQVDIAKKVETPRSAVTGSSSFKNAEKRSRSQDQLNTEASPSSRPAKKSKKKHTDIVEESLLPKQSRATSVPPPSTVRPSLLELRAAKPQTKKQMNKTVSEPQGEADSGPVASELAVPQEEAPQVKTKRKQTKSKEDSVVGAGPSGKPSKTATGTSKDGSSTKGKQQKVDASSSPLPTETTKKVAKLSEKRSRDQAAPAAEMATENPSEVLEAKTPMTGKGEATDDETAQYNMEQLRAATVAAVRAVLTRKGMATSGPEAAAPKPVAAPAAVNKAATKAARTTGPKKAHPPPTVQDNEDHQTPDACPICDESPNHDPPTCPVIKGGVKTMRKRVAELEKITSEEREEERKQVLADLQERIRKRSRKPRVLNGVPPASVDGPTSTSHQGTQDTPASLSKAMKPSKQVDVVSPSTPVVNVVPPATSSQPPAGKPQSKRLLPSLLPPTSLKSSSSSQKQSKTSGKPKKPPTANLMNAFPTAANTDLQNLGDLSRHSDLSRLTDNDLLSLISGPKLSIEDMPSSGEDEDEEAEREELVSDEEEEMKEKVSKQLGQNISHLEYPSLSDAEEESESEQASSSKLDTPSPQSSTMLEGERGGEPLSEEPLSGLGDKDTSSGDVNDQGSSADLNMERNNAVDDTQTQDTVPPSPVPASSFKHKAPEADSDTVVASQSSEVVVKTKSTKATKANGVLPVADEIHDPIEPCEGDLSDEVPESIASDGGNPQAQSTPKVELVIRTRSQRNKESGQSPGNQEDREISEPKGSKKITELPVPPNPSARVIKAAPAPNNRTRGQKASRETKGAGEEESSPLALRTKNTKAIPKAAEKGAKTSVKPISKVAKSSKAAKELADAVNKATGADKASATPKPKPKAPAKFIPGLLRKSPPDDGKAFEQYTSVVSQWAILESNPSLMETSGQFDELLSDSGTIVSRSQLTETSNIKAMINGSAAQEPLFLPATQQTSPGGVSFGSQKTDTGQEPSPHDSEDEDEVIASVVKDKPTQRKFRGLSNIVNPSFQTAKFHSAKNSKVKEVVKDESDEEESEDDESDSDSESGPASHIPVSRKAGSTTSKRK